MRALLFEVEWTRHQKGGKGSLSQTVFRLITRDGTEGVSAFFDDFMGSHHCDLRGHFHRVDSSSRTSTIVDRHSLLSSCLCLFVVSLKRMRRSSKESKTLF
jgi:hypothetical protein